MMSESNITDLESLRAHRGFGRLLAYVDSKRQGHRWAPRSAIDPTEIPALLPHLWLIEVSATAPRLLVRLAGTRVGAAYGRTLSGTYLEELDWGPNSPRIFATLHGMADRGVGHFLDASAQIQPRLSRRVQRLGLPLSLDQARVSHLILLAFYEFTRGAAAGSNPEHFRGFWLEAETCETGRGAGGALHETP